MDHYRPTPQLSPPARAFPETHSAEIFSALRNLQEKIRRLELEKTHVDLDLQAMRGIAPHSPQRRAERLSDVTSTHQREARREEAGIGDQFHCNQVLITQLAAAESRCQQLERQLDHMRRMVRHAKADRTSLLKQQVG
ncbi:hypothetical protein CRUP_032994 [Coryphaenoides rupestris]|nr:hypothetical protein CRUP_032994 [Coryphaenoides rupestris]